MNSLRISLSTDRILAAFNRAALHYDELSGFHRQVADELIKKVFANIIHPNSILDIGCGSGYLTVKARDSFMHSKITGVDFSQGMLDVAKNNDQGITWVLADACHLPFGNEAFDLVISNLAFQWVADLSKGFSETRRVLSKNGMLVATVFGYRSCEELFTSLESCGYQNKLNRLANVSETQESLKQAGFGSIHVDAELVKLPFRNLLELLRWLKAIGTNRLSQGIFLGPQAIQKASAYCLANFSSSKGISITFEIIKIQASF